MSSGSTTIWYGVVTRPERSARLELTRVGHPMLSGIGRHFLEALAAGTTAVAFAKGEYLFRAGEPADRLYLVTRGAVAFEERRPGARPHRLGVARAGEAAGESSLQPPYVRRSDGRALEVTTALAIESGILAHALAAWPMDGVQFLERLLRLAAPESAGAVGTGARRAER